MKTFYCALLLLVLASAAQPSEVICDYIDDIIEGVNREQMHHEEIFNEE